MILPMENKASNQPVEQEAPPVMHSFSGRPQISSRVSPPKALLILLVVALLGLGSGYLIATATGKSSNVSFLGANSLKGKTFGSTDTSVFKDTVEGKLEVGGVDGEGQYHLVRSGGESQNVYLTSSLIDLSQFVGLNIKVWGETQAAQKVGWLMDVGRVKVL